MNRTEKTKESIKNMATHEGKVKIGDLVLPCYVIDEKIRVFSRRGIDKIFNVKAGGNSHNFNVQKSPRLLGSKRIKPFICNDLLMCTNDPIVFKTKNGKETIGYNSSCLPLICETVIRASENGLFKNRPEIIDSAKTLYQAFARVGLISLVDEATGYQEHREHDALQKILNLYLNKHARKWTKTFPETFWQKLVKIYQIKPTRRGLPQYVGNIINEIVYDRLAPNVTKKLKELNRRNENGQLKKCHHQYLTDNHGLPELKSHLVKLEAFMDASFSVSDFKMLVDKALPKYLEERLF